MKTLLLIDGNAIMHRAFHAIPPFKTKNGIPTNIVYGFFSMLYKGINNFKPSHIIVCFDTPKPTFRNKLFKKYQAQRPKIADEFKEQIPFVKEALIKGGITYLEKDGFEADDLIGTITKKFSQEGKVMILTGDKDIWQLIKENVFVIAPQTGISGIKIVDTYEVEKRWGIKPNLIVDFKSLVGDQSDNYMGAKGIGPKTASKLLTKFQSIDNLFNNLDLIDNKKLKKIIIDCKENILLSKQLATINQDVKIEFNEKKFVFNNFKEDLKAYLVQFEMKSLAQRLFGEKKLITNEDKTKKQSNIQIKLFF